MQYHKRMREGCRNIPAVLHMRCQIMSTKLSAATDRDTVAPRKRMCCFRHTQLAVFPTSRAEKWRPGCWICILWRIMVLSIPVVHVTGEYRVRIHHDAIFTWYSAFLRVSPHSLLTLLVIIFWYENCLKTPKEKLRGHRRSVYNWTTLAIKISCVVIKRTHVGVHVFTLACHATSCAAVGTMTADKGRQHYWIKRDG